MYNIDPDKKLPMRFINMWIKAIRATSVYHKLRDLDEDELKLLNECTKKAFKKKPKLNPK